MGRCAISKRFEHVAESRFDHFGGDLEDFFEDGFLDVGLVDADGAAAEFGAVDDDVVVLAANFLGFGFEEWDVVRDGGSKRMVAGVPAVLFFVEAEEGEIDDPKEVELVSGDVEFAFGFEDFGAVEADAAEDFAGVEPLVGGEEDEVAFLDGELLGEGGFFGVREKFHDG